MYKTTLKGILLTAKLGEKIWEGDGVYAEVLRIQDLVRDTLKMRVVKAKQLPSNRQEILIWGRR